MVSGFCTAELLVQALSDRICAYIRSSIDMSLINCLMYNEFHQMIIGIPALFRNIGILPWNVAQAQAKSICD